MRKILLAFKKLFSGRRKKKKAENESEKTAYICDAERNFECTKEGCWTFSGGPCRCTTKKQFAKKDEKGNAVVAKDEDLFSLEWIEQQLMIRSDPASNQ